MDMPKNYPIRLADLLLNVVKAIDARHLLPESERIIATWQKMRALRGVDEVPRIARKCELQSAVWTHNKCATLGLIYLHTLWPGCICPAPAL